MKNKITKVLAALLTLCMLVGMFVMPASAEGAIVADETWYKEDADVLYIYDAADLLAFSAEGQDKNFAGKTVKLMADVDLNPGWDATTVVASDKTVTLANAPANVWTPIPTFRGTLDGNGHTVSGIYSHTDFTVPNSSVRVEGGFIDTLENGTIKDLAVRNSLSFFESTTGRNGTSKIHIGGFIGHAVDANLTTLFVDMDAWVKFDWHFNFGGMISAMGTNNDAYSGTVKDIVFAGSTGVISKTSNEYNTSGSRGDNIRYGGVIAANLSWNYDKNIGLIMQNIAFTGVAYWPGKASGDDILCFTGGGSYNIGIGVDNAAFYHDYAAANSKEEILSPTTLSSTADDIFGNKNVTGGNADDTYETAGWKAVEVKDNAAYANAAKFSTILLPGSVVDMLTSNSLSTSDLYVQEKLDGSAIRFIGVVDVSEAELANLDSLGMNVSMTYAGKTYSYSFTTTTVYKSLLAGGVTVDVSELNGTYFYAIEITGLNGATGDVKFDFSGTVTPNGANSVVFASASYTYAK